MSPSQRTPRAQHTQLIFLSLSSAAEVICAAVFNYSGFCRHLESIFDCMRIETTYFVAFKTFFLLSAKQKKTMFHSSAPLSIHQLKHMGRWIFERDCIANICNLVRFEAYIESAWMVTIPLAVQERAQFFRKIFNCHHFQRISTARMVLFRKSCNPQSRSIIYVVNLLILFASRQRNLKMSWNSHRWPIKPVTRNRLTAGTRHAHTPAGFYCS